VTTITANELKTRGLSALDSILAGESEVIVSVRGKNRYVIMSMPAYSHMRECELESALAECRADIKAGRVHKDGIAAHLKRVGRA
jgi:hypothetical protein